MFHISAAVAGVPLVSPDMAGGLVQGVRPRGGPGPLGGGGLLLSPLAPPRGPVPAHPHHHQHHHHHHHPHQQQPPQQLVYLPCVQPPTSLEARKPGLLDTQVGGTHRLFLGARPCVFEAEIERNLLIEGLEDRFSNTFLNKLWLLLVGLVFIGIAIIQ